MTKKQGDDQYGYDPDCAAAHPRPYTKNMGQYAHSCKNGHMTGSAEYPLIR
jgi:hypothetical protein